MDNFDKKYEQDKYLEELYPGVLDEVEEYM